MINPVMHSSQNRCGLIANILAALTILLGMTVLAGWIFHIPDLTTFPIGFVNMTVNTALGLLLCGTALLLGLQKQRNWTAGGIACLCGFVALVGIATLVEYILLRDPGIDDLLFLNYPRTTSPDNPGRMAPSTALLLISTSVALFALWRGRRGAMLAQLLAVISFFYLLILATGYSFYAKFYITIFSVTHIALTSIFGFLLLVAGILLARVDIGFTRVFLAQAGSGQVARRLLMPVIWFIRRKCV